MTASLSERRVLLVVITTTTAGVLPVFLFGGLAVQVSSDLELSTAAKGQAVFGYFAISALASAWSGRLTERFGPGPLLRAAAVIGALSAAGVATSRSFVPLFLTLSFGGLANAFAQPAANALVVHQVATQRQGFALGVKQAAIPTATLLAGLAVPSIALTIGWRWAFAGAAGLAIGALLLVPHGSVTGGALLRPGSQHPPELRIAPLLVLACGVGLGSAVANALGAFTTSSAVDAGIGAGAAGALLATGSALGLCLRIISGWLADRRTGGHLIAVAAMLAGGALGLVAMSTGRQTALVFGTLLAFASGWSWPGVFNLAVVRHHPETPAAATGITQTGAYAGGAAGPLLMGGLVERGNYDQAWLVFAMIALLSAAVLLCGRELLKRSNQELNAATNASA